MYVCMRACVGWGQAKVGDMEQLREVTENEGVEKKKMWRKSFSGLKEREKETQAFIPFHVMTLLLLQC